MTILLTNQNFIKVFNIAAFAVLSILAAASIFKTARGRKNGIAAVSADYSKYIYIALYALIILIGLGVRLYSFGSVPCGMNYDEAMTAVDAKALADYGADHYGMTFPVQMQAWKRGQQSAFLPYLTAPFVKLFGLNALTVRLPALILSCIGALCFVLLIKDLYGNKCALIAAFMIAINPWHILQSRWALDANTFPHMFIISAFLLNRGFKNRRFLYASMVFFGICMYTYTLSIYCVPLFLVICAVYALWKKRISVKTILICAAVYLIISMPFYLCMVINLMKWDTIEIGAVTIPRFYETQRSDDMIFFSTQPLQRLILNIKALFETVVLQNSQLPQNAVKGFGFFYMFSIPAAIAGLFSLFTEKNSASRLIILSTLCGGILIALITPATSIWRVAVMNYAIIALDVLGIQLIASALRHISLTSIALYLLAFVMFTASYFTYYADDIKRHFFGGFGEALSYLNTLDADKYYITSESQFKTSSDVSEIYTLFYHDIDSKYFLGETNSMNGKEYLPYSARYIYSNISPDDINPEENAAYLITVEEKQYFDENLYNFKEYVGYQTNYLTVTRKKIS